MAIIMLIASLVRVIDIDVYRVNDLIILAAEESPEVGSFRRREYPLLPNKGKLTALSMKDSA